MTNDFGLFRIDYIGVKMANKKVSGQTIVIIVLAILLILTVCFGGVYAYYSSRTSMVSGRIIMANLEISVDSSSGMSETLISQDIYWPGMTLKNSSLTIKNSSNTDIYIAVVYSVVCYQDNEQEFIKYDTSQPIIDVGADKEGSLWTDYEFRSTRKGEEIAIRCLITKEPVLTTTSKVEVIPEDGLKLSVHMGDEFQRKIISFMFQAYAISSGSVESEFPQDATQEQKCNVIMNGIYEAYEHNIEYRAQFGE